MTPRRLAAAGVVLVLLIGLAAAAGRYLERVPVTVWRGASVEARREPRLALERLLAAGGITPHLVVPGDPGALLPARAVMWLDEAASDPARGATDRTWQWVEAGGTLVLSPAAEGGPFSDRLGLRRRQVTRSADGRLFDAPASIAVGLPGSQRRYEIEAPVGFLLPVAPRRAHGDGGGGLAVAEVPVGRGRIVIVADLAVAWTNSHIGLREHAAFLWALARLNGPRAPLLFTRVRPTGITATTIVRRGWPVIVGGAVLGLLALWRVLPRVGPLWPPPAPARRQLGEHLQAVGTFHLRSGHREMLVDAAQRAVRDRLRRQPWAARPSDLAALAVSPSSAAETLVLLQRLHDFWRRLHRA